MTIKTARPQRRVPLADGAEYARVNPRTIRRWIASGIITGYRVGPKLIQVDLDDIDSVIQAVPAVPVRTA